MLIVIACTSCCEAPWTGRKRRATFAAVVAIIATIDVPICFMITPHSVVHSPVVLREGGALRPRDGHVRGPVRARHAAPWASYCTARVSARYALSPSASKRSKGPSTTNDRKSHESILADIYSTITALRPYIIARPTRFCGGRNKMYVLVVFRGTREAAAPAHASRGGRGRSAGEGPRGGRVAIRDPCRICCARSDSKWRLAAAVFRNMARLPGDA